MPHFANIFQPLIDVFEEVLVFFHDTVGFSWGWSIVAMTVVVRLLLLPLAIRQYKSMRAMQRLGPEIKALREKYGNDRDRLNRETMKLYQEHRVNPFGACLPLVFQLPVFVALFYMLRKDLRLDICPTINPPGTSNPKPCGDGYPGADFLGIPDITNKAVGTTLVILLVLYVGTQLISTLVMAMPNADRNQKLLMLALPFVFIPFIIGFPAGLLVYWITTNLWTLVQQFTIRETLGRRWDRQHEAALAAAGGDPSVAFAHKKQGRFSAMMAKAQEAQEQAKSGAGGGGKSGGAKGAAKRPANGKASGGDKPAAPTPRSAAAPPRPPRKKKKKRSGRRR